MPPEWQRDITDNRRIVQNIVVVESSFIESAKPMDWLDTVTREARIPVQVVNLLDVRRLKQPVIPYGPLSRQ